jgi:hypothetical protein
MRSGTAACAARADWCIEPPIMQNGLVSSQGQRAGIVRGCSPNAGAVSATSLPTQKRACFQKKLQFADGQWQDAYSVADARLGEIQYHAYRSRLGPVWKPRVLAPP